MRNNFQNEGDDLLIISFKSAITKNRNYVFNKINLIQKLFLIMIVWVTVIFSANAQGLRKDNEQEKEQQEFSGKSANEKIAGAQYYREGRNSPFPSFIIFSQDQKIKVSDFFTDLSKTINYNQDIKFNLTSTEKDRYGLTHYHFNETFKGLPVEDGMYVLHARNDLVVSVSGEGYNFLPVLSEIPAIDEKSALNAAINFVGAASYKWQEPLWEKEIKNRTGKADASYFPKATLLWYVFNNEINGIESQKKLVYRFDIHAAKPDFSQRIFIDAQTGEFIGQKPLEIACNFSDSVQTIFNGNRIISASTKPNGQYILYNDCDSAKIHVWDWNSITPVRDSIEITSNDNTWTTQTQRFGATVSWAIERCITFWEMNYDRHSYDNNYGNVNAYVNAVMAFPPNIISTDNATMSITGGEMKIGLGSNGTLSNSFGTLDIIAHEYTHAVTGVKLNYQGESGALNESFSDIFGEVVENNVLQANDWLIGSDRDSAALRSMSNPKKFKQPNTYKKVFWANGNGDNGGVHKNSGVQNFWFYLLVNGKSGTNDNGFNYKVTGIGLSEATNIAADALLQYSTPNSTYRDMMGSTVLAASSIYGYSSFELSQVIKAWEAVGVGIDSLGFKVTDYNGYSISCNGGNNDTVTLSPFFGVQPYTYLWSGGQTTNPVVGLSAGTHTVTVTDANGKSKSTWYVITEPYLIETAATITNNDCYYNKNGKIELNVIGGVKPYTYLWSIGATTKNLLNKKGGIYTVVITDKNGCVYTRISTISQHPEVFITATVTKPVCSGESNGNISITLSGGTPPFYFYWNDGSTMLSRDTIPAGLYTLYVSDQSSCTKALSVLLSPTSDMAINFTTNNHYATAKVTKGKVPYTYLWNTNPAQTNKTATGLTFGQTYQVTVSDQVNCTKTGTVTMPASKETLEEKVSLNLVVHPNPASEILVAELENANTINYDIEIFDNSGRLVYSMPQTNNVTSINLKDFSNGLYSVKVLVQNSVYIQRVMIQHK